MGKNFSIFSKNNFIKMVIYNVEVVINSALNRAYKMQTFVYFLLKVLRDQSKTKVKSTCLCQEMVGNGNPVALQDSFKLN